MTTTDFTPDRTTMTVIGYDDWYALYYGDTLVYEGHDIPVHEIVYLIQKEKVNTAQLISNEALYGWLLDRGRFACPFSEIPKEVLSDND